MLRRLPSNRAAIRCWRRTTASVRQGLTLGLGDILRARRILLLVSGAAKQEPLARLADRRVTPALPASFLWLHGDAVCLCDEDAAAGMSLDGDSR